MFPALALANEFTKRGHEAMMVTDERGASLVESVIEVKKIPTAAFFGRSLADKFLSVRAFMKGTRQSKKLMDEYRPDAVIGAGGYASFPVIRAARAKKIPLFLLEQNSVQGRVTRMSARAAREIYCGIPPVPVTHHHKARNATLLKKAIFTGNVLRKSVILKESGKGREILILGGSGGAQRLNLLGYELAERMPRERFILLTGRRDYELLKAKPLLDNLELVAFTFHPEELYARARIAVSRAGALSLSELLVNGIPSILIPFPYAVDDHQTFNARWAEAAGAAVTVSEKEIERVEVMLHDLLENKARRTRMSEAARELVPSDAAEVIVARIEKCLAA
ncbi:UDP-N-acetylglucosamine--N-acetylmuramyl-(pentapeptide) pyrophosphoryl-undecaprenol N-acetylglucosamine transferase [candidate division WOR-3 bacterium]|nr:UDP-N-acetylglucosamine--N-acetylmuramyl-(pentapeptide) pyrophosphoryl-undecaprenol N-acetylglucosamine transferase [candidate division WOR-3 bacterium]